MRNDTETHCHCGAEYRGSDHCAECGCEQYESDDCGRTHEPADPDLRGWVVMMLLPPVIVILYIVYNLFF